MDKKTNDMLQSTTEITMPGSKYFAVQIVEQAPDLILPMPK